MDTDDSPETDVAETSAPQASAPGTSGWTSKLGLWAILGALVVLAGGVFYTLRAKESTEADSVAASLEALGVIDAFEAGTYLSEFDQPDSPPDSLPLTADPDRNAVRSGELTMAFVNRAPGDEYGHLGYLDKSGERVITEIDCERVDLNEHRGICLSAAGGLTQTATGRILNQNLASTVEFPVNKPSRATVSPSGNIVAWTGFTQGHSYLQAGEFATVTQLISVEEGVAADLEFGFQTFWDGVHYLEADRNYWGVTFVDDNTFYSTMGSAGQTVLVKGDISAGLLEVVYENASCPEISPDGSTIVAKEQRGDAFQLIAIDVATGQRRDLGETEMVDDQVEWIDEDTIAYARPNSSGTDEEPAFDIWAVDLDEGSEPRLLIPFADSPAAI